MASIEMLKRRTRSDYGYLLEFRTRWKDNDQYAHMNNAVYIDLYDSVVNTYLIQHCDFDPKAGEQYGMVVHSQNDYFSSISFPAVAELALRVIKLGRSSVTYEIALFQKGVDAVRSVGQFTQVFVDRSTNRPNTLGVTVAIRQGLQKIMTEFGPSKL